jgi:hypothetical protein
MDGYETQLPCDVCGQNNDNVIEPRFGYVVCSEHADVLPVVIDIRAALDKG